ncbi:MAG: hypothetical protein INH37_15745 [Myxococcaceae bacterium]|nr:hypothetical protein [Myxococcaceae bacterium]
MCPRRAPHATASTPYTGRAVCHHPSRRLDAVTAANASDGGLGGEAGDVLEAHAPLASGVAMRVGDLPGAHTAEDDRDEGRARRL